MVDQPSAQPMLAMQIKLNGDGVVAPVYRAVRDSVEVIGIALDAMEKVDLTNVPRIPGAMMGFSMSSPEPVDVPERKVAYTNWLLGKGFQDLARAMNEALQEAYFYVEVLNEPDGQTTWGALQAKFQAIRTRANAMHFPELVKAVSQRLNTPLVFADEYASLQKVRNCLEHRGGVVTARDVGVSGVLKLRFPTFDIVIEAGGKEILVAEQEWIDLEADGKVLLKVGRIEKEFKLGERVLLTPFEFQRIAQGCLHFCTDLGSKLPTREFAVAAGGAS